MSNGSCPVCGEKRQRLLYPAAGEETAQPGSLYFETGHGPIVQCQLCGMIYACPQLPGADLELEYGEAEGREYMSELLGRERQFAEAYDLIERFAPRGRLLDVGCFTGVSLAVARKRGWQVTGIEPSQVGRAIASERFGLELRPGLLPDPTIASESFEAVTLWDVIEHVPDPGAVVGECWRVMKPGGVLGVGTPDIGSPLARLMGERRYFTLGHLVQRLRAYAPITSRSLGLFLGLSPGLQKWLVPINLFDTIIVIAEKPKA